MRRHTSGDIRLAAPDDWHVPDDAPDALLALAAPRVSGRFAPNVVLTSEEVVEEQTRVQWAQRLVAVLRDQVSRLRVIDLEDVPVAGRTARRVLSHYPLPGHGGIVLEQWLVPDGRRGIVVSCSAGTPEYDEWADVFGEMAATLRVGAR